MIPIQVRSKSRGKSNEDKPVGKAQNSNLQPQSLISTVNPNRPRLDTLATNHLKRFRDQPKFQPSNDREKLLFQDSQQPSDKPLENQEGVASQVVNQRVSQKKQISRMMEEKAEEQEENFIRKSDVKDTSKLKQSRMVHRNQSEDGPSAQRQSQMKMEEGFPIEPQIVSTRKRRTWKKGKEPQFQEIEIMLYENMKTQTLNKLTFLTPKNIFQDLMRQFFDDQAQPSQNQPNKTFFKAEGGWIQRAESRRQKKGEK